MDPSFFNTQQQQWMHNAAAWPPGMVPPWFQYPGTMPFPGVATGAPLGLYPPVQQPQQPVLTELQAATHQQANTQTAPTTPLNDVGNGAEAVITPPPSGNDSNSTTPPPAQLAWNEGYETTPTGRPSAADAASFMHAPAAEAVAAEPAQDSNSQPQQTQKRKKAGGCDEDNEGKESNPSSPSAKMPKMANVFCEVAGRLSVVGAQRNYCVTSDEIFRRISLPENLNRSLLGPLLRRGKVKGCGNDLQQLLEKRGLAAQKIVNRKQHALSTLSALLEEEAVQLSADHRELVFSKFPLVDISRLIIKSFRSPAELTAAAAEAKLAKATMDSLLAVVQAWTNGGWLSGVDTILASPMAHFALATHGLGVEECLLFVSLFSRFLVVFDQECDAYMGRVSAATANNMQWMMSYQFPPGVEPPEIKAGSLHVPDNVEEARASASFADIPGRLTLQNKKHNVTVAEIFRRVRAPESLNLSILGSLLKKGKTKDNGNTLRDELAREGINIDQGRRKSARITLFTSLLEAEALTLAKDLEEEMKRSFPFSDLTAALVASARVTTPMEIHSSRAAFNATSRIASSFAEAVESMRLPVGERIPYRVADHAYLMLPYSSLTHGYGPDACLSWISCLHNLFAVAGQSLPIVSNY